MRTRRSRSAAAAAAGCLLALTASTAAVAHEERRSELPDGTGTTPTARPYDPDAPHLVVCKPASAAAVRDMPEGPVKALNEQLLGRCAFEHLQAAVDAVTERGTSIYVLPGLYREEPSWDPPCTEGYDGGVVDYPLIVSCGEVINLVTVAGDATPHDRVVDCNQLCDLQIEGTGTRMEDVVLRGGFREDGDWVKHNGVKADRADGFVLRNMTLELFRENAVYVHETDGFLVDRVDARHNDLYGILMFASDHGVISNCDTSYNGDSGIYPGSAADVNADNPGTGPLTRWSVEIFGCRTHHNAMGLSGTAGNSVWFHDNEVFDNQTGYVTDSFITDHPGMPQDHAWLTGNRIYRNNSNYVKEFVQSGRCSGKPAERGHGEGTVCPKLPTPVGTGVMIAGGNRNLVERNEVFDNWRAGVKLLWVPGAVRGDMELAQQYDTSHGNHFTENVLGRHPEGVTQPNGRDVEWDEQGVGNCWQGNVAATGEVTHDAALPLPDCDSGGSRSPVGNVTKSALMAPCTEYNREDNPDPPGCDWFVSPTEPAGREPAPDEPARDEPASVPASSGGDDGTDVPAPGGSVSVLARTLPATGSALLPALTGLVLAAGVLHLRRRAREAS